MKRSITISICLLLAIAFLASCSASGDSAPSENVQHQPPAASSAPASSAPLEAPMSSTVTNPPAGGPPDSSDSSNGSLIPLPILTPSEAEGKKLIYTLTLNLQTTEFMLGMRKLLDTVSHVDGYLMFANVEGRDMRSPEVERKADYEFRVPTERLTELLMVIEDNYNLLSLRQVTDDATIEYDSSGYRLEDLLEQEQRLLETLGSEEETPDRLDLERRLSDVQTLIRHLQSYQVSVDDSVIYSTLVIHLFEVIFTEEVVPEPVPPVPFGERLGTRISNSIEVFVELCQGLLLLIIAIAPVLLVLAILGGLTLVIVRIVKRYRKKRPPTNPRSSSYPPTILSSPPPLPRSTPPSPPESAPPGDGQHPHHPPDSDDQ